jgi:DNA-binding PadR family transcriptional regulator
MNEMGLSNAGVAVLGLLSEKPMHPYRIEQEVKERNMREWTELSMSSIYKVLRKLEKHGLVFKQVRRSPGNRLQKLYAISPEGERLLRSKIGEFLTRPGRTYWAVDIGTYYSKLLPEKEIREALHAYRMALRERITGYRKLQEDLAGKGSPLHRQAMAIRAVYLLEAEISWVNSFLSQL